MFLEIAYTNPRNTLIERPTRIMIVSSRRCRFHGMVIAWVFQPFVREAGDLIFHRDETG